MCKGFWYNGCFKLWWIWGKFEWNIYGLFLEFEEMLRILVFECRDFVKVFFVIFIN